MPGFHLYRSASTQALADRFVEVVTAPDGALPLDQDEVVVVQGRGMERWLSQRVATKLGVWAGAEFPYPRAAAMQLAARVLGEAQPPRVTDDALVLTFAVAAELPALMATPQGERVRAYVGESGERLLSFAEQAAGVLDGYLVFRPELLDAWSEGAVEAGDVDAQWQAALWRAVQRRARAMEVAESSLARIVDFWPRIRKATEALKNGAPCAGVQRLSVFAVASVPPQLVEFLAAIGRVCDVHWYAVDPAAETAGSPAAIVASLARADLEAVTVVRDAAGRAREAGVTVVDSVLPAPAALAAQSLLARTQKLARTGSAENGMGFDVQDRSLRVHACSGRMREAEVLHDEILRAFDELPGLTLEDVVVLCPDIGACAPAVEAVLRGGRGVPAPGGTARLASSVADVSDRDGSPMAVALSTALAIADGDMGVRSVLELLGQPVVAEKFLPHSIAPHDVARWLVDAGARRFLDAEHRAQTGLPATDECSWESALDRLYAGLASPPAARDAEPHARIFPAQPFLVNAAALGALSEFVELMRSVRALVRENGQAARSISYWMSRIRELLLRLAPRHGDAEREARALSQQFGAVEQAAIAAGFVESVPFGAVRSMLTDRLNMGRPGRGFLGGGVTVCQFVPMRAVPFRLVCMLGMDDDKFPRATTRPGFDIMGRDPRPGDRDARAEDRALFLESVMGAGERLVISYASRDLTTGGDRAASTAVAELLDAAAGVASPADATVKQLEDARHRLVIEHPLHAFSVAAFDASARQGDRVGYDASARMAAERLQSGLMDERAGVFLRSGETNVASDPLLSLNELAQFFRDPAKATLRAWGVRLPYDADGAPEHELVAVGAMEGGRIRRAVLDGALAHDGRVQRDVVDRLRQEGRLPIGAYGAMEGGALVAEVEAALQQAYPQGAQFVEIDLCIGRTRLTGSVPIEQGALTAVVSGAPDARNAHRLLHAWVLQLAYSATVDRAPEGVLVAARGKKATAIPRVARAEALRLLGNLIALREFGLAHGLPFFCNASWKAAASLARAIPEERIIEDACDTDSDDHIGLSEFERTLFRGLDPYTVDLGEVKGVCRAQFLDVARTVCEGWAQSPGAKL